MPDWIKEVSQINTESAAKMAGVPYSDLETKKTYNCYKLPTQTEILQRRIDAKV